MAEGVQAAPAEARTSYHAVKADLLGRIARGQWGPGALLPGEVELARGYGCARATVNRAMRELAEEGVVERRRKAGTRVRASPRRRARLDIPLVRQEVEERGAAYGYALLSRELVEAPGAWLRGAARARAGRGGAAAALPAPRGRRALPARRPLDQPRRAAARAARGGLLGGRPERVAGGHRALLASRDRLPRRPGQRAPRGPTRLRAGRRALRGRAHHLVGGGGCSPTSGCTTVRGHRVTTRC